MLLQYKGDNKEIVVPDGVISIGINAFSECKKLTSIIILDTIKRILIGAFCKISNLTSIIFKNPKVLKVGETPLKDLNDSVCAVKYLTEIYNTYSYSSDKYLLNTHNMFINNT